MFVTRTIRRAELLLTGDQHGRRWVPMGRMYFSLPSGGGGVGTRVGVHDNVNPRPRRGQEEEANWDPACEGRRPTCKVHMCGVRGQMCIQVPSSHGRISTLPRYVRDCPEWTTDCT